MDSSIEQGLAEAYKQAKNYPDLVSRLIELGILSYTVDVATGTMLYRMAHGQNHLHLAKQSERKVSELFQKSLVSNAIADNQQGKTDYPGFMAAIAAAGVIFYEATLNGPNKRVSYIGIGSMHEELIPLKR